MKRLSIVSVAAVMTFALSATDPQLAVADNGSDITYSPVVPFPAGDPNDPEDFQGMSQLVRTDNGVNMTLMATGLEPGVYSVWWAINFGTSDFSLGFAASHVVGPNGDARFGGNLRQGEPLSQFGALDDARGDNVHLVVRYHGPVDPGRLHEQLSTFEPTNAVNLLFSPHDIP